jgi:hypothetical protein
MTRKMQQAAPLWRARSIGLASRAPDSQVLPALVGRLNDGDPVVRLAAHEELRRRTGQDFGYIPWAAPPERTAAVESWRAWIGGDQLSTVQAIPSAVSPASPDKSLPGRAAMMRTSWQNRSGTDGSASPGARPPTEEINHASGS